MKEVKYLLEQFEKARDIEQAKKMSQYMKNLFPFYGVSAVPRREIQKRWYATFQLENDSDKLLEIACYLWQEPNRECQYAAIDLLEKNKKKLLNASHLPFLEKLIVEKSWWDSVDLNICNLIGYLLKENTSLLKEKTQEWMCSENKWLQRTAILTQLKYKSDTDFDLLKKVCVHLKDETDFFIRKAIGWAFREYGKVNSDEVKAFILSENFSKLTKKEALKHLA